MPRQSVRVAFGESPGALAARATSLDVPPPHSVRALIDAFDADLVYEQEIVMDDDVPLGGHFKLVLHRDGQWDFTGHFRASGFPTYTVSLLACVNFPLADPNGGAPMAAQLVFAAHGTVHGSNEPGSNLYEWVQHDTHPLIEPNWSAIRGGVFNRRVEHNTDWFGLVGDIASFFGPIIAMNAVAGPAGVAIALAGDAASAVGLDEPILPGLVGVTLAAGAAYLISPGLAIPVFIAGAIATPALIKQQALSDDERAFAEKVFKGTLPYDRILKTNLIGPTGHAFTTPGPGEVIFINLGDGYGHTMSYDGWGRTAGTAAPGQLFIHELVHVWQIVHDTFTPWYYCEALTTAAYSATSKAAHDAVYGYGLPDVPWGDLGTEQQAQVVCDWFAGKADPTPNHNLQITYKPMREDDPPTPGDPLNPYFRYVRDHIRAGVT
jgi:hypothetical protein